MKLTLIGFAVFLSLAAISQESSGSMSSEEIRVIKISGKDQMAVIKTLDDTIRLIRVGDSIGLNGKVTGISRGRIIIEEQSERGVETVIIRFDGAKQTLERISRTPRKTGGFFGSATTDKEGTQHNND